METKQINCDVHEACDFALQWIFLKQYMKQT